jgi:HAD superfamily hydrolase (TIGR01549 family)
MDLRVIILDFDGVILESERIKDSAFEQIFRAYPRHLERIMRYHQEHSAVIRFEKFRYIYEEIIKETYPPELEQQLTERFAQIVFNQILTAPFVPGAEEFLRSYAPRCPLYIASVNPAGELRRILEQRGLMTYFREIYASPWKKSEAIFHILTREECAKEEALFIGDSYEDYLAAKESGVIFIGRDSGKSFRGAPIPVFPDLLAIDQHIKSLNRHGLRRSESSNAQI